MLKQFFHSIKVHNYVYAAYVVTNLQHERLGAFNSLDSFVRSMGPLKSLVIHTRKPGLIIICKHFKDGSLKFKSPALDG